MEPDSRSLTLPDPDATARLGLALGRSAQAGDIILLSGDLGAGKTTLTQAIARGLGIEERVTSPTFSLLHEYDEGRVPLYHFDLYRLTEEDIAAQAFPDYWEQGDGLAVLEWAERLGSLTPPQRLEIHLAHAGDGRTATLVARGDRPHHWLQQVASDAEA
ncbi:MAG TPA: tRNA (adenosine(37)-N6)-threonylcarbamoyltransferase complex ATPase subunit type 1 TsaE [Stenomitos sp.]